MLSRHRGEIIFRKQRFDVFSNPNVIPVLNIVQPERIVVYGVALDVCDKYAVEGFLKLGKYDIWLVEDATKPIYPEAAEKLLEEWSKKGVRIVKTADIVEKEALFTEAVVS